MASDLISIARSGAQAARIGLDVTAQNIANAGTAGYVRRSVSLKEVSASGGMGSAGDLSLSGVRLDSIVRNADLFRQSEVRRTGADAARVDAEVNGLENVEAAIEQSRVYPSLVEFEGSLQRLAGEPTDPALRAGVIEAARTLVGTFNIAATGLDGAGTGLRFEASAGVTQVNTLASELARVNLRLSRATEASSDQSTLLDQRDNLLQQMSTYGDVSATFAADGTVQVRMGGNAGPLLVQGGTANAYTTDAAGNASYAGTATSGDLPLGEGQSVTRGLTGPEFLNFTANGTPGDLLATLKALGDALQGGVADPQAAAHSSLDALDASMDRITTAQTVIGSRMAWIDLTTERATDLGEMRADEETTVGGTDMAATVAKLQQAMTVLEASQASFAKLAQLSLFDVIR